MAAKKPVSSLTHPVSDASGRSVLVLLLGLLCVCWFASIKAKAAELQATHLAEANGSYVLRTEVLVEAAADRVRNALADYENLPSLNPNIESVKVLERGEGWLRVRLQTKTCVFFLCQRYEWVQRVTTAANGDILAEVEPQASDLRRGTFRYSFRSKGEKTLLVTQAEVEPRHGVPSGWFGRGIMRNLLGHEAITLSSRLERQLAAGPTIQRVSPS